MAHVALADKGQALSHPQSFITKYIWSQDHKVIAIQYGITAIAVGVVALILSGIMRLQLGFPDTFSFIQPSEYYQFVTMHGIGHYCRHDGQYQRDAKASQCGHQITTLPTQKWPNGHRGDHRDH